MGALDPLEDLACWDGASPPERAAAVTAAVERLGSAFTHVRTATYTCGGASHEIATLRHAPTGIELQLLPGGRYTRGAAEERKFDDAYNWWSEDKVDYENSRSLVGEERVRPLALGRAPLTRRQWTTLCGGSGGEDLVASGVSWKEAARRLASVGLRLPSDAEWEWGCRAGTATRYFWGDDLDPERCVCAREREDLVLDEKTANAFGLVAMLGTVWEWVGDRPRCTYLWKADMSNDPSGDPGEDHYRILRGGSWASAHERCRSSSFQFVMLADDADEAGASDDGADAELDEVGIRVAVSLIRDYHTTRRFEVGERLIHSKFGEGVVTSHDGRKLQVRFADGPRTLVQGTK